jgi:hypothetical protein
MKDYFPNNQLSNKIVPRSARRVRKPLQDDWIKGPGQGVWLKCTYAKCSFQWQYFGRHRWAECPICHSVIKVAAAKRNFMIQNKPNPRIAQEPSNTRRAKTE